MRLNITYLAENWTTDYGPLTIHQELRMMIFGLRRLWSAVRGPIIAFLKT
jgi:hypothetical protein